MATNFVTGMAVIIICTMLAGMTVAAATGGFAALFAAAVLVMFVGTPIVAALLQAGTVHFKG